MPQGCGGRVLNCMQTKIEAPTAPAKKQKEKKSLEEVAKKEVKATPPISGTLAKAEAAIKAAMKTKQKQRKVWRCTECGDIGIQLYYIPGEGHIRGISPLDDGHFHVAIDDDEPVNPKTGEPLTGTEARVMKAANGRKSYNPTFKK